MNELVNQYMAGLFEAKQQIKQAIINKGGVIEGGLSSYADAINAIEVSVSGEDADLGTVSKTIDKNGSYVYYASEDDLDGYSTVVVNVDVPEQYFETQSKSILITKNGSQTVTPDSGYGGLSEVSISVEVAGGGGGDSGKPKILNGFRFTGGDIASVDFSQYDWSMVYDTSQFFKDCTHSTNDWTNFEENFNGKILSGNNMFYGCSNLTSLPQLDTSKVADFSRLFYQCSSLTSIPQLDTSNATSTKDMFAACTKLTSIPQLNTSNVTDTSGMFNSCAKLISIPQLDTSNVKTFGGASLSYGMFVNCYNLESVGVLDLSSATHLGYMFQDCYKLREVKFKGDPSKATATNTTFNQAGKNVEGGSTLYYDSRYDYSKIINNLPSTWTAVPYDVVE